MIFHDPLALRIVGMTRGRISLHELRAPSRPYSRSLRAFVVARSRFAEDTMHAAAAEGWTQYVLLGAGLDTFAYRQTHGSLCVFEVDHPATQAWKQELLQGNGIPRPETCRYVPVDFERDRLRDRLAAAGFRADLPAVFAWLGVVPYLTREAMRSTLEVLGTQQGGARLVLDYTLPRDMLPPKEQLALDSLSARVAQAGEPFRQFFSPEQIRQELQDFHFAIAQDLDASEINARYFDDRQDELRVLGRGAHLLLADKPGCDT